MKHSRAERAEAAEPDFKDLMGSRGLTPEDIKVTHKVSVSTVYRARRGDVPEHPLLLAALAQAVGVSTEECRAAILRVRPGSRRSARA